MAIIAVALLCGCTGKGTFSMVEPVPVPVDLDNLGDTTLPASFTAQDFNWRGSLLTLSLYTEDVYDAREVASLRKGDTLVFSGNRIVVKDLKWEEGFLTVNGGIEQGGAYLQKRDEDIWRSCLMDDHSVYHKVGSVGLLLDEDFTITDCGAEPTDPILTVETGQKAYIDDLPEYKKTFSELDTKVQIKDGRIVSINRRWIP